MERSRVGCSIRLLAPAYERDLPRRIPDQQLGRRLEAQRVCLFAGLARHFVRRAIRDTSNLAGRDETLAQDRHDVDVLRLESRISVFRTPESAVAPMRQRQRVVNLVTARAVARVQPFTEGAEDGDDREIDVCAAG